MLPSHSKRVRPHNSPPATISAQPPTWVSPTKEMPKILPAINCPEEMEVISTSMVRFSFSSTTACIK